LAPFGQAVSEEKIFLTLANKKKELILAEWNQMQKFYKGSYIDASCQVWLHLFHHFLAHLAQRAM
jgi:isocitrate dehydrogenase